MNWGMPLEQWIIMIPTIIMEDHIWEQVIGTLWLMEVGMIMDEHRQILIHMYAVLFLDGILKKN